MKELSSMERVKLALQHREPDRVPFDLGSTTATGITVGAYERLLNCLNLTREKVVVAEINLQLAKIDEEVLEALKVDTWMLSPGSLAGNRKPEITEDRGYIYFTDAWGVGWKMPQVGGHYYDMYKHPLQGGINKERIDHYPFPNATDFIQTIGLKGEFVYLFRVRIALSLHKPAVLF